MGEQNRKLVAITIDGLQEIIQKAAEQGATRAIERMNKQEKAFQKKQVDRRIHNTRLLLRNYRTLKDGCQNAVYEKSEDISTILDNIDNLDKDEVIVESIKRTASRTALIISHIDKMLDVHRVFCNKQGEIYRRQHKVIMSMYINKNRKTRAELAEQYGVSTVTIHKDIKDAVERLSALIFGVDGLKLR